MKGALDVVYARNYRYQAAGFDDKRPSRAFHVDDGYAKPAVE
jgi:hypothetical protein